MELGGHRLPPGAQIFYSPYALHRDPLWYRNPDAFDPDRWDPQRHPAPPRGTYLPFAAGVHGCPGGDFALAELTLLTAAVTAAWRVDPVPGSRPRPMAAATLGPAPLTATVTAHP